MSSRVFLIHWNQEEAAQHAETIRSYGWQVAGIESEDGGRAYRSVGELKPDAIVIYLTRLPSHGRQTAKAIRERKATREIPIIFIGGKDEPLAKTKEVVPGGHFVQETELEATLTLLA